MGTYVVSARKYRPQHFDEVVGQEQVASTLKKALETDQLAHAYLFCGPRGVGKTTCARILARVINEEKNAENTKTELDAFNVVELDAASNNSVEHIRSLIDQVRIRPQSGKYKVFIIDEVHMLSQSAFNAFLKTLEEPPAYAIFILATTEKHKILPTILSRCQIFDFKRIQVNDIVAQLRKICTEENITAEDEALHTLALKADGAMRDALSLFDKAVSFADDGLTYQSVVDCLNLLDADYYFKISDLLIKEDFSNTMLQLDEIISNGFDVSSVLEGLAEHFRNLLMCKSTQTEVLLEVSSSQKERYINQAKLFEESYLLSGLNMLSQSSMQMQRSNNRRLHAELALSKIVFLKRTFTFSEEGVKKKLVS